DAISSSEYGLVKSGTSSPARRARCLRLASVVTGLFVLLDRRPAPDPPACATQAGGRIDHAAGVATRRAAVRRHPQRHEASPAGDLLVQGARTDLVVSATRRPAQRQEIAVGRHAGRRVALT